MRSGDRQHQARCLPGRRRPNAPWDPKLTEAALRLAVRHRRRARGGKAGGHGCHTSAARPATHDSRDDPALGGRQRRRVHRSTAKVVVTELGHSVDDRKDLPMITTAPQQPKKPQLTRSREVDQSGSTRQDRPKPRAQTYRARHGEACRGDWLCDRASAGWPLARAFPARA
jgi:hypothetical protein